MEGYLYKYEGFFSRWAKHYFILHEDTLIMMDHENGKIEGQIHLSVAKVHNVPKDALAIQIFNGTNEVMIRASSIKEKVDWTNAIVQCQQVLQEGRYQSKRTKEINVDEIESSQMPYGGQGGGGSHRGDGSTKPGGRSSVSTANHMSKTDWNEQLNLAFCTKVFNPESAFFKKLGHIWELEAELEELVSLIVPEAIRTKNLLLIDYADKISNVSQNMKADITECAVEMEDTRKEMFRVAKLMAKLKGDVITGTNTFQAAGQAYQQNQLATQSSHSDHSSPAKKISQKFGNTSLLSPESKTMAKLNQDSPRSVQQNKQQVKMFANDENDYKSVQPVAQNNSQQYQQSNNSSVNPRELGNGIQKQRSVQQEEEIKEQQTSNTNNQQLDIVIPPQINKKKIKMGFDNALCTYTMRERDSLPFLVPENQSFSIWAILKDAIGKDLSKITMPIWLNEPNSMLQKISEQMHYHHIMEKAMEIKNDDVKRLAYIGIYILSQYSDVYGRDRKPFNPILGETFELVQPTFRWISEQVSHHPPVCAYYAEGKGYYQQGNTNVKNYFWGGSLEFRTIGLQHMVLTDTNEQITIKRPDNSANNLIMGKLYVDVHGKLEVTNLTKNIKVELTIQRQGWTKKNAYKVEGTANDSQGVTKYAIRGTWNESLYCKNLQTKEEELVFQADPKPPKYERQYCFGYYTINLNHIDEDMKLYLPPTDTRRRMDQRLMEEGHYDQAAAEKTRLEDKQRAARKANEEQGIHHKPYYFVEVDDTIAGDNTTTYKYNGLYWDKRKKLDWSHCPDLF